MHGTRGAGLLQPTGEAVRCRSHLATSNSFGARAPARGTPRSVLSALASLAQRSRSRAVGAVASDAPAHVPLDGVEGQHYEREGEGDAEAELPLHVEAERGEDVADRLITPQDCETAPAAGGARKKNNGVARRLVEVRLVRLKRQAEERLVPTPVEPRTHAAREEQTAAQAGLGGGDDLLELPRKVDEERLHYPGLVRTFAGYGIVHESVYARARSMVWYGMVWCGQVWWCVCVCVGRETRRRDALVPVLMPTGNHARNSVERSGATRGRSSLHT